MSSYIRSGLPKFDVRAGHTSTAKRSDFRKRIGLNYMVTLSQPYLRPFLVGTTPTLISGGSDPNSHRHRLVTRCSKFGFTISHIPEVMPLSIHGNGGPASHLVLDWSKMVSRALLHLRLREHRISFFARTSSRRLFGLLNAYTRVFGISICRSELR